MARQPVERLVLFPMAILAASCAPGTRVVDPYGSQAFATVREAAECIRPGKTTLKEVAPQYDAPGPATLTWPDALAYADKHFGQEDPRRIFFLWRHLKPGQPRSDVNAIWKYQMPYPPLHTGPFTISYGSGGRESFQSFFYTKADSDRERARIFGEEKEAKAPRVVVGRDGEIASIYGWHAKGGEQPIQSLSCLTIPVVAARGTVSLCVCLGRSGLVESFTVNRDFPEKNLRISVSGNLIERRSIILARLPEGQLPPLAAWDELAKLGEIPGYSARLYRLGQPEGAYHFDEREYDEDLTVTTRTVNGNIEFFVNGFPYKRVRNRNWLLPGPATERVEWFPLPKADLLDDATLEKAARHAAVAASDERSLDLLRLAGPRALPFIRKHFRTDGDAVNWDWIGVCADMGTADAIELILGYVEREESLPTRQFATLLEMDGSVHVCHEYQWDERRPGALACAALCRTWKASREPVLAALRARESSPARKRFCVRVIGQSRDPATLGLLAGALRDEVTSWTAAETLRDLGSAEAERILRDALSSDSPPAQTAARNALDTLELRRKLSK